MAGASGVALAVAARLGWLQGAWPPDDRIEIALAIGSSRRRAAGRRAAPRRRRPAPGRGRRHDAAAGRLRCGQSDPVLRLDPAVRHGCRLYLATRWWGAVAAEALGARRTPPVRPARPVRAGCAARASGAWRGRPFSRSTADRHGRPTGSRPSGAPSADWGGRLRVPCSASARAEGRAGVAPRYGAAAAGAGRSVTVTSSSVSGWRGGRRRALSRASA